MTLKRDDRRDEAGGYWFRLTRDLVEQLAVGKVPAQVRADAKEHLRPLSAIGQTRGKRQRKATRQRGE